MLGENTVSQFSWEIEKKPLEKVIRTNTLQDSDTLTSLGFIRLLIVKVEISLQLYKKGLKEYVIMIILSMFG